MTEEEKRNLDFLSIQYRKKVIELKNNEKMTQLRKKLLILFFIVFLYTFITIAAFSLEKFENEFIRNLFFLLFEGLNIYVYVFFASYYIEQIEAKSNEIITDIDNIVKDINIILGSYNINKDNFFEDLESNIIN